MHKYISQSTFVFTSGHSYIKFTPLSKERPRWLSQLSFHETSSSSGILFPWLGMEKDVNETETHKPMHIISCPHLLASLVGKIWLNKTQLLALNHMLDGWILTGVYSIWSYLQINNSTGSKVEHVWNHLLQLDGLLIPGEVYLLDWRDKIQSPKKPNRKIKVDSLQSIQMYHSIRI